MLKPHFNPYPLRIFVLDEKEEYQPYYWIDERGLVGGNGYATLFFKAVLCP